MRRTGRLLLRVLLIAAIAGAIAAIVLKLRRRGAPEWDASAPWEPAPADPPSSTTTAPETTAVEAPDAPPEPAPPPTDSAEAHEPPPPSAAHAFVAPVADRPEPPAWFEREEAAAEVDDDESAFEAAPEPVAADEPEREAEPAEEAAPEPGAAPEPEPEAQPAAETATEPSAGFDTTTPPAYRARRAAEQKSTRDIIRCLNRYISSEVYQAIRANFKISL